MAVEEFDMTAFMGGVEPAAEATLPIEDAGVTPPPPNEPKKRHRRSKAELEAAGYYADKRDPVTQKGVNPEPTHEEKLAELDARGEALDADGPAAVPNWQPYGAPGMIFGAADQQAWEESQKKAAANGKDKIQEYVEAPPDASDYQVLVDEIHYLREDLRDVATEVRKLTLEMERTREAGAPKR